jgi:RHS repeat-associated protein
LNGKELEAEIACLPSTVGKPDGQATPSQLKQTYTRSITNTAGASSTYTYDDNGNMTSDSRSGISYIAYDMNNLPIDIYRTNGDHYICSYGVDGNRVRKSKIGGPETFYVNGPDGTTEAVQNGVGNSNYTYNIIGHDNIGQAYRLPSGITRYYYLKDHLGSVRMVVKSDGTLDAYNDYYPYGMQMPTRNQTASADARYKFTGKERDVETAYGSAQGYDYFGARYYDSWRGQWGQVDPMSPLRPEYSPYAYVYNNPSSLIDPFGLDTTLTDDRGGKQYQYDDVFCFAPRLRSISGSRNNSSGGIGTGPSNGSRNGNDSGGNKNESNQSQTGQQNTNSNAIKSKGRILTISAGIYYAAGSKGRFKNRGIAINLSTGDILFYSQEGNAKGLALDGGISFALSREMSFEDFVGQNYHMNDLSSNPNGETAAVNVVIVGGGVSYDSQGNPSSAQISFGPGIGFYFYGVQETNYKIW